ncbi:MAG: alpha/beta hydrolase [Saprospiraceae bacterium]
MKYWYITLFTLLIIAESGAQTENQTTMQAWEYPYQVHRITVSDSIEIAYIDEGQGDHTLLFLHGLGSNLQAWQKNINQLKSNYRCIALDLPGYGKSGKGNYASDMTFFARSVRAFIDTIELEKVVLVGHSMGGQIAMHIVLNNPNRIEKLVLVAPAGFETFTETEKTWFQNIFTPAVVKATPEEQIIKNFELNFYDMQDDARFMIEDRLLMRQTAEYDHYCNMIPKCVMGMLREPVYDRLTDINLPTLVVYGADDQLIPNRLLHPTLTTVQVAQDGQQQIPDSRLILLPQAGHFAQWDQSESFNGAVSDFLK